MRFFPALLILFVGTLLNAQSYNYYFGNLHAHTAFSDGNKDSLVSGVGRPDGSYAYAKLSNNFDFLGISEHNHYSNNRNPGFKQPLYQVGLNMANAANQDGTFLALFGMEYGVSSNYNGHVITYGFNQLIGWENSVPGVTGNNYDIYNAKTDYDGFFRKVKNNPGAFCYLAHPDFNDFSTGQSQATSLANAPYNAAYDSAIVGTPLRSGLAFSTFTDYSDYSTGNYFAYYRRLLYQGYHLGIGYDHDNHYTNFGRSNGGRLVILAPSLTRANLYAAMQQMHFYGSDDSNARVEFTMNGNIMGSILTGSVYPTFNVVHNDPDGEMADTLRIWKGHSNSGGLWAEVVHTGLQNNTASFYDENILPGIEYYYFAEIKQADGQWIVTSPIWYTGTAPVFLKRPSALNNIKSFPNPASGNLSISPGEVGVYHVIISDISGRTMLERTITGQDINLDISSLAPGVYQLLVENERWRYSQRLVVHE